MTTPRAAFDAELVAALPAMRKRALQLTRNGDRANDLVQDTSLRMLVRWESFDPSTTFGPWAMTVLWHLFVSNTRAPLRHTEDVATVEHPDLVTPAPQEHRIAARQALIAIDRLPTAKRAAVVQSALMGLSADEIAVAAGTSAITARTNLAKARAQLRRVMGGTVEADRPNRGKKSPPTRDLSRSAGMLSVEELRA